MIWYFIIGFIVMGLIGYVNKFHLESSNHKSTEKFNSETNLDLSKSKYYI